MNSAKIHLPYVLGKLLWTDFEGLAELSHGEIQRTIVFYDGQPVNVWSLLQEETLGRMLVEQGKVSSKDYVRLIDMMVQTRKNAGEVLTEMGILQAHEVFMALEYQVHRKLLNCLKMRRLRLVLKKKKIAPESIILNVNSAQVLFYGIAQGYSKERLEEEFPIESNTVLSRKKAVDSLYGLHAKQIEILQQLEEKKTFELLEKANKNQPELKAVLYGLHALNLIDLGAGKPRSMPALDKLLQGCRRKRTIRLTCHAEKQSSDSSCDDSRAGPALFDSSSMGEDGFPTTSMEISMEEFFRRRGISPKLAKKVLALPYADHFSLLDVDPQATQEQIRDAFYQLIETYRLNDTSSSYTSRVDIQMADRLLDRATVAFRELSDPKSRATYTRALRQHKTEKRTIAPRLLSEVQALKGELALGAGLYKKARKLFRQAIELYPIDPSYHHKLGLSQYLEFADPGSSQNSLPDSIREAFEEALRVDPNYAPSRLYLGKIMARCGELVSAVREFEQVLLAHPDHKQADAMWSRLKELLAEEKQENK